MDKKRLVIGAIVVAVSLGGFVVMKMTQSSDTPSTIPIATPTNPNDPAVKGLNIN